MHLFFLYFKQNRYVEAIILSATSDRLRIAVKGTNDTVELRMIDGEWIAEEHETVQLEWLIREDNCPMDGFIPQPAPRAFAAG
jgi:hypothetical protein